MRILNADFSHKKERIFSIAPFCALSLRARDVPFTVFIISHKFVHVKYFAQICAKIIKKEVIKCLITGKV